MIFKRYRFQLVARSLLLVASAILLAYLVSWTDRFYAPLAVGLAIIYQVVALVYYAEKAPRDITRFLESIRQADFSQGATARKRGPLFDQLSTAYVEVMAEFQRIRGEKEEHLRYLQTVVQHVGIALISFRSDDTVELINTAAKRLLDLRHLKNIGDLASLSTPLVQTLRRLESGEQAVVKVVQEDQELQLAVYATRFRLRGETHAIVSLQDIRGELEEKEMEAWQRLTRVLTHEIMNSAAPIASLAATAHRLLDAHLSEVSPVPEGIEDTREALAAIERRSQTLVHFTDSYRSFTKIPTPQFEVFPVRALFAPVHRLLRVQAEEQGIDFSTHITPETLELTADEGLLEQVLINLLLNAMDALAGRADARLELRARIDRHGRALLQVVDNGPGIPPELQERIFVPFFTTREGGSGIGLSLSRQIMRLHGGSLSVRCEPEVETVFILRF